MRERATMARHKERDHRSSNCSHSSRRSPTDTDQGLQDRDVWEIASCMPEGNRIVGPNGDQLNIGFFAKRYSDEPHGRSGQGSTSAVVVRIDVRHDDIHDFVVDVCDWTWWRSVKV
jgi:hypothetical protein